ncbi:DUF4124 domain-containing protein [Kineococcus sp. T13]|uniref:DUF4124 domain-containing protein n=1 Tax=Kineococcus vitellinus TaxID=2696565 RepID=UPI001412BD40|nr:DUF4124 domain-containing protein [Kineococcus vitellinus]NAZ74009.1 DUF4124 domain-containing protein [Kineococcus vitellinus]
MSRTSRRLAAAFAATAVLAGGVVSTGAAAQAADVHVSPGRRSVSATAGQNLMADFRGPAGTPFSAVSVWKQDVSGAPLHASSAAMVSNVADQAAKYYGGIAAFNAYRYNTSVYTVSASTPKVDVRWDNCQKKTYTPGGLTGPGGQFTQVPVPDDAVPSPGTDGELTIYSPGTDQLWEFWQAKKVGGTWQACWGGRIDRVSSDPGYFSGGFGASASGLAIVGGTIGIKEAQAGRIDHALALAIPAPGNWNEFSWPAQRSDGYDKSAGRVPEGTRLRLDPSIDVDSLKLTPIATMVAKAAQKYGFIVTDKAGCVAVTAESPAATIAATGVDPWKALMQGKPDYRIMEGFPWGKLQALPKDWGKPSSPKR